MAFTAGQTLTAALLNQATRKIIARGRRTTTSTTTTTEVGVLRLDDIPIEAGRLYRVSSGDLLASSTVTNDNTFAQVRYTTDGSTPTTSSPVLAGSGSRAGVDSATNGETLHIEASYTPSGAEVLSLLLTVGRLSGTGNASIYADGTNFTIDLYVADLGLDPGDTGTDI